MRNSMSTFSNYIICTYILSFISSLFIDGQDVTFLRIGFILYIFYLGIRLTSIANRGKFKYFYNRSYTILISNIILILLVTPMRYWVISLAIPLLAFYYFRVRNETRDVCLSDFRDLKKIALRIDSSEVMRYIMDRIIILGVAYFASNVMFIDNRVAKNYVPMIIPILIHDIVMIVLYFQMDYVPETEEGSARKIQSQNSS